MNRALLLNADYSPLHFVSDFDAVILFYKGRAEVINGIDGSPSVWDATFNSPSTTIRVPATMRLLKRVNKKWKQPRFRKKVLFNRDNWSCQYCSIQLNWETITIEHVVPKSQGGQTTWHNCAAACKPCNKKKANRTPEQAGMRLINRPTTPSSLDFWDAAKSSIWHQDWDAYIRTRE